MDRSYWMNEWIKVIGYEMDRSYWMDDWMEGIG